MGDQSQGGSTRPNSSESEVECLESETPLASRCNTAPGSTGSLASSSHLWLPSPTHLPCKPPPPVNTTSTDVATVLKYTDSYD